METLLYKRRCIIGRERKFQANDRRGKGYIEVNK